MTLRSIVFLVACRFPFIAAGYLGAFLAAIFVVMFVAVLVFVSSVGVPRSGRIEVIHLIVIVASFIPIMVVIVLFGAVPAALAVTAGEALRVRSVWFHAAGGALTGIIAYSTYRAETARLASPLIWLPLLTSWLPFLAVLGGLVGGIAYWIIAVRIAEPRGAGHGRLSVNVGRDRWW